MTTLRGRSLTIRHESSRQGEVVLKAHEITQGFPYYTERDLDALAEAIHRNGLQQSISTLDGKILDGRNRYRACQIADVQPRFEEYTGTWGQAVALVWYQETERRQECYMQRLLGGVALSKLYEVSAASDSPEFVIPPPPGAGLVGDTEGVLNRDLVHAINAITGVAELLEESGTEELRKSLRANALDLAECVQALLAQVPD